MNYTFADNINGLKPSAIREILKLSSQPGIIPFSAGNPAGEAFPAEEIAKISNDILLNDPASALQYSVTEGYAPLREYMFKYMQSKYSVGSSDDDIIICTIGTNNRHQYKTEDKMHSKKEHMQIFYNNILKLAGMFKDAKKDVIFVANIPAGIENERRNDEEVIRIFNMCDINDMYLKASAQCAFPFISMYNAFMNYCTIKNISVDSLLIDALHPNDEGYTVMYNLIMNELGLGRKILDW